MRNSLRCCLACVLPCGALDVIRIVHLNGYVEELTGPVTAGEILKANPNHVLTKPTASSSAAAQYHPQAGSVLLRRRILILSPDSELKRGSIYFLIPAASASTASSTPPSSSPHRMVKNKNNNNKKKKYMQDASAHVFEKKLCKGRRRGGGHGHGRVDGVWRPHLQSISELD